MDKSAIDDEVLTLHGIPTIDVAVNGWEGHVFTWGGLAVRRIKGNRIGDGALNREKSAEAIVPDCMPRTGYGEGPNGSRTVTETNMSISPRRQKIMLPEGKNDGIVRNGKERGAI